jgi:hypothetical protein
LNNFRTTGGVNVIDAVLAKGIDSLNRVLRRMVTRLKPG